VNLVAIPVSFFGCINPEAGSDALPPRPEMHAADSTLRPTDKPTFADEFPGFRFEGGVETLEPEAWPFVQLATIDAYRDSTRVIVVNQNLAQSITNYLAGNFHAGRTTQWYSHRGLPNNELNSTTFQFVNPSFLMTSFNPKNGNYIETGMVFGIATRQARIITWSRQYNTQFVDRYIIRYISDISLWPYHAWNDVDEKPFIATSEESDPKTTTHLFLEGMPNFPYDLKSNMYSGFLQSKNDGTYVGIAKGDKNLDTAWINNLSPTTYKPSSCQALLDKHDDTLHLAILTDVANSGKLLTSLYRLVEGQNVLEPLYKDLELPGTRVHFRRGHIYVLRDGIYQRINTEGTYENVEYLKGVASRNLVFKREKIFGVRYRDDLSGVEYYSRDYE
jgi:hypothetical protein